MVPFGIILGSRISRTGAIARLELLGPLFRVCQCPANSEQPRVISLSHAIFYVLVPWALTKFVIFTAFHVSVMLHVYKFVTTSKVFNPPPPLGTHGMTTVEPNNIQGCTFGQTGSKPELQKWYWCHTCGLTGSLGCCSVCVVSCHAGHDTQFRHTINCFCDCGAGSGKSDCQCLKGT